MADIIGTTGSNTLNDTFTFGIPGLRNDRISALAGNDTITISDGDDVVFGGSGNDRITDGALVGFFSGNDEIFGEEGNDTIIAGEGRDTINGAPIPTRWITAGRAAGSSSTSGRPPHNRAAWLRATA
ncbi:calcium-binding protein [Gemmobacter lanyuensis]